MNPTLVQPAPRWISVSGRLLRLLPYGRYRLMHWIGRHSQSEFLVQMPKEFGGFTFRCNLRDTISREVCFTGQYEPQETALVRSILGPGMSFVDVGANWGYFTLLAAQMVGHNGRVFSLEPDPRLFMALEYNVKLSQLSQVTALQIAAAHETTTLTLAGYSETGNNFGVSRIVDKPNGQTQVFQVKADSLDHLLEQHEFKSVDLVKMDIEGAEGLALLGLAKSLYEKRVKRLLLELHPRLLAEHGSTAAAVIALLHEAGYEAWTIDHSSTANRQAAYKGRQILNTLLKPLDPYKPLDEWPHQLWLAPGIS
jgi:FkbM family methyltransferase